jgi:hypothetical protein
LSSSFNHGNSLLAWRRYAVPQVLTVTLGGTWEADDIVIITITDENGATQSLSVTTGSTNTTTIATTVATNYNASTKSLFTPITASASTNTMTFHGRRRRHALLPGDHQHRGERQRS